MWPPLIKRSKTRLRPSTVSLQWPGLNLLSPGSILVLVKTEVKCTFHAYPERKWTSHAKNGRITKPFGRSKVPLPVIQKPNIGYTSWGCREQALSITYCASPTWSKVCSRGTWDWIIHSGLRMQELFRNTLHQGIKLSRMSFEDSRTLERIPLSRSA